MAAKGFIELELERADKRGTYVFKCRPELISMYRECDDTGGTLVWLDPHDGPFICVDTVEEFEMMLNNQHVIDF